jgi:pyridoxamine 5'-phosphate oxidase family protein
MLGVLVAETWPIGSPQAFGSGGPIATAMVDLARSLTGATTRDALGEVADRHDGIAGPAWLLPLALAHSEPIELAADAAGLAARADVPPNEVHACVAYVELAAHIVAEQPVPAAITRVAGLAVPPRKPDSPTCPPSVSPLSDDTIVSGGIDLTKTIRYRHLLESPQATIVIDDLVSVDPWRPRGVKIRGPATLEDDGGHPRIRIRPQVVWSWGINTGDSSL